MLARRFLCRKRLWQASCNCMPVRLVQSASQHALDTLNLETRLPAPLEKEPQRQPFVKNLFLGLYDKEFMYYPEPQTKERHQRFFEWLQPIEKYMSERLEDPRGVKKEDVLSHLRDLGVFRAHLDEKHLGLNLNQTELTKVVEVLSCLPWLGSYMVKNHITPVHIISTLGSDEQKAKYLPKIATGEIVPTVCFTEPEKYGINTHNMESIAEPSDCDTYYTLNGEKSFVVNGHDSNLFLVFSRCGYPQAISSAHNTLIPVFLVERDFGGVTCEDVKNLAGLQDSPVCTVSFKNTKIPKGNLLGEAKAGINILVDSLAPGNRNIAPQAVGILRVFTKLLTRHVLQRKHLNRNLYKFEGVQEIIGRIASTLYSMESMLYFTTGIIDTFENQDCTLEKAMAEMFCANECVACIYEGLQIIGVQSYMRDNHYIQMFEDALSYILLDSYNVDSSTYIALLGLQHMGKNLRDQIFKLRNPFHFPAYILKWSLGRKYQLNLRLSDHMHPSLGNSGKAIEKCIARLQAASMQMLERHGSEIAERQMELRRLSEIAMRTFALITVISRTSRSYSIGLRNSELERHVTNSFGILTVDKIQVLTEEIMTSDWNNGDKLHKSIAELMYDKQDYFAEHPLNRTY